MLCSPRPADATPTSDADLFAIMNEAVATVVGRVGSPQPLDATGYGADLIIERTLSGQKAAGTRQRIVWEELAPGRGVRFADGDRILVALVAVQGGSLWQQRLSPLGGRRAVLAVGGSGRAFVSGPDQGSVDAVAAYLSLPAATREDPVGLEALANVVVVAAPFLATAAVVRMSRSAALAGNLTPATNERLLSAARRTDAPGLTAAIIALARDRQVAQLRPMLETLAQRGGPWEAEALLAIAALDGGLDRPRVDALLRRPEPALRAAAIRGSAASLPTERLSDWLHNDPSPLVRAAVVERLVQARGAAAVADVLPALADDDPGVRELTARQIGALGEAGVAALLAARPQGPPAAATGIVLALDHAGAAGTPALRQLAATDADPQVRSLARLALGRVPGHEH
jgi:hypothetical protein